jgi:hypothetical protein
MRSVPAGARSQPGAVSVDSAFRLPEKAEAVRRMREDYYQFLQRQGIRPCELTPHQTG